KSKGGGPPFELPPGAGLRPASAGSRRERLRRCERPPEILFPMTLFDDDAAASIEFPARVRMTVAYDGRGFHGFAAQAGHKTVGGALATAIRKVLGHPVELTCAGRTDKGVHAWGQVVSFDAE